MHCPKRGCFSVQVLTAPHPSFPGFLRDPWLRLLRFLPLLLPGCIGDCLETGRYHFITVLLKRIEHGLCNLLVISTAQSKNVSCTWHREAAGLMRILSAGESLISPGLATQELLSVGDTVPGSLPSGCSGPSVRIGNACSSLPPQPGKPWVDSSLG